jgi:hypothetical protein
VLAFSLHALFAFLHLILHLLRNGCVYGYGTISTELSSQRQKLLIAAATKCEESKGWL